MKAEFTANKENIKVNHFKKILITALLLGTAFNLPAFAGSSTLQEIQDLPSGNATVADPAKAFDKDHWAYKSLKNISEKYGLLVGKPDEKFDGSKPLTRNEAAVILVNLTGKIEESNAALTESEKTQLDILRQELKSETQKLTGRVAALETSVDSLKGSVSKLEETDKKQWQYGFGEKFKINGIFQAKYAGNIRKGADNYPSNFSIPLSEFDFSGQFYPHINYSVGLRGDRAFTSSAKGLLGDAFVSTDLIPHHTIYLGQTRVPIGYEGTLSATVLETLDRSQISRKFSDTRDLGIKAAGNWNFVDYSIGTYNGNGQNSADTNNDLTVASWLVLKPLYKYPQLGKLEVGGGYEIGKNSVSNQNISSFYTGYKYKKYGIRGEYAFSNGYTTADQKANGWYIHNSYDLTKKLQLIARYDQFDPNTKTAKDLISEYVLGSSYLLADNVKLQLNLVYVNNQAGRNSERAGILTQYKF